jgi:DNA-binding transcriptional MerR regulator
LLRAVPQEKFYSNTELAKKLGIPEATLRTYKSYFTKVGITFNKKGKKVVYTEEQFQMFRDMLKLHREGNNTIKECVESVVNSIQHVESSVESVVNTYSTNTTDSTNSTNETITYTVVEDLLKRVSLLENQTNEQKEKIGFLNEELAKMPERDKQLMNIIREIQEVKKEVAASKEKKWWQFWK